MNALKGFQLAHGAGKTADELARVKLDDFIGFEAACVGDVRGDCYLAADVQLR